MTPLSYHSSNLLLTALETMRLLVRVSVSCFNRMVHIFKNCFHHYIRFFLESEIFTIQKKEIKTSAMC